MCVMHETICVSDFCFIWACKCKMIQKKNLLDICTVVQCQFCWNSEIGCGVQTENYWRVWVQHYCRIWDLFPYGLPSQLLKLLFQMVKGHVDKDTTSRVGVKVNKSSRRCRRRSSIVFSQEIFAGKWEHVFSTKERNSWMTTLRIFSACEIESNCYQNKQVQIVCSKEKSYPGGQEVAFTPACYYKEKIWYSWWL